MGRKPLIKDTEWQDIVDRCIADNWTSAAISLYLKSRYGYEVNDSTIRRYRKDERKRIEKEYADWIVESEQRAFIEAHQANDHLVDHLGLMGEMIRLQRARLEVDLRVEEDFSKLLPSTRHEIELLGNMIHEYHEMLQDFEVVPKAGDVGVGMGVAAPGSIVSFPLMEELDDEERSKVIDISRAVHKKAQQKQLEAGSE